MCSWPFALDRTGVETAAARARSLEQGQTAPAALPLLRFCPQSLVSAPSTMSSAGPQVIYTVSEVCQRVQLILTLTVFSQGSIMYVCFNYLYSPKSVCRMLGCFLTFLLHLLLNKAIKVGIHETRADSQICSYPT